MSKSKRKIFKFLVVVWIASFLIRSNMIIDVLGIDLSDAMQIEQLEKESKQEISSKQQGILEEESSNEEEQSIEENSEKREESQVTEEIIKEEFLEETAGDEISVIEEIIQEESSIIKEITTEEILTEKETVKTEAVLEEMSKEEETSFVIEEIYFNTGRKTYQVVSKEDFFEKEIGDVYFEEDGSYTIQILEDNPFFPYEVQFTYNGKITNRWFMTPDDSIEIGGHVFYISAYFDGSAVTQISFNVAGDKVIVYPEEKEFTDEDGGELLSLLPLETFLLEVDLSSYTPAELTMVSLDSIFTGEYKLEDTDKIAYGYGYRDKYNSFEGDFVVVNANEKIDLSYGSSFNLAPNGSSEPRWQLIVGDGDPLGLNNINYHIAIIKADPKNWLIPTVYKQDSTGVRTNINILNSSYNNSDRLLKTYISYDGLNNTTPIYIGLDINQSIFANAQYNKFKIFEGKYTSASEAIKGTDITDRICGTDITQRDNGYPVKIKQDYWFTMVTFDERNQVTGCLPFIFSLYGRGSDINCQIAAINEMDSVIGMDDIVYQTVITEKDGCKYFTKILYKEYAADENFFLECSFNEEFVEDLEPNKGKAFAYFGQYSSISEAKAANGKDYYGTLFRGDGIMSIDLSQGCYITVFVGEDGDENQEIYKFHIQTKTGTTSIATKQEEYEPRPYFGALSSAYSTPDKEDSYGEFNYLTILVKEDVDLTSFAPTFREGLTLYAEGSNSPEVSGKSAHDFSKGPVQYTASSEDGTASKNYWLHVLKPNREGANLYINSLSDKDANTRIENNIIYSTREVFLDGYHNYIHDIVLINIGENAIPSLSVELISNEMELDDYWTLQGKYELSGLGGDWHSLDRWSWDRKVTRSLAKIRIRAKEGIQNSTQTSGKLVIKSGNTILMELTLTGVIGDPCIITKELPSAVQYVPYGTMIQNNNKYSWNYVTYSIEEGKLPNGMELKSNGELYGVPLEKGTFPITIKAINSSSEFGSSLAKLVLIVNENTNTNVYTASDNGYMIEKHIGTEAGAGTYDFVVSEFRDQLFVSSGEYEEFVDLWLNGEKLVDGEDYIKDSGSTRITIRSQTFEKKAKINDRNTIAAEFRVGRDESKELKRTAQNFRLDLKNNSGSSNSGNSGSSGSSESFDSNGDLDSSENSSSNTSSNNGTVQNNNTNNDVVLITYTDDSWIKDEAGWWCKNPDGSWLSNTWFQLPYNGTTGWYYFNDQGYMIIGWLLKNGKWYYLNPVSDGTQGMMCIGWKLINGQWCYFDKDGVLVMNTWHQIPYMETTKWYYFNEQGYMVSDWLFRNNKWYYLSPVSDQTQGMMCTGWQFVDGKWYYLNPDGDLATDTWIEDYYVNSDGVWVE